MLAAESGGALSFGLPQRKMRLFFLCGKECLIPLRCVGKQGMNLKTR